jgi:hypothetical protein
MFGGWRRSLLRCGDFFCIGNKWQYSRIMMPCLSDTWHLPLTVPPQALGPFLWVLEFIPEMMQPTRRTTSSNERGRANWGGLLTKMNEALGSSR